MSYTHIEVKCFIIDSIDVGESSRSYLLLCENLGPLWAKATSVRKQQSKLRYHLQQYSNLRITLIEGREYFRIVGVSDFENSFKFEELGAKEKELVARIFQLFRRLLVGEERSSELYKFVVRCLKYLEENKGMDSDLIFAFEIAIVANILMIQGYVDKKTFELPSGDINEEYLREIFSKKKEVLLLVNNALKSSHL